MKTVIRDRGTGFLYCWPHEWTPSWTQASDFGDLERARAEARNLSRRCVEVVVIDDDGKPMAGVKVEKEQ